MEDMIDLLYKISTYILAFMLLLMIVLISIVGVGENVLTVLGWITAFFITSSIVLFFIKRRRS